VYLPKRVLLQMLLP